MSVMVTISSSGLTIENQIRDIPPELFSLRCYANASVLDCRVLCGCVKAVQYCWSRVDDVIVPFSGFADFFLDHRLSI